MLPQSSTTLSFLEPVLDFKQDDNDNILKQKGYKKIKKICNTLQGEMILCKKLNNINNMDKMKKCAIKKIDRCLYENNICVDEYGMTAKGVVKSCL